MYPNKIRYSITKELVRKTTFTSNDGISSKVEGHKSIVHSKHGTGKQDVCLLPVTHSWGFKVDSLFMPTLNIKHLAIRYPGSDEFVQNIPLFFYKG
jgi:hypothetical protein